MNSTNTTDEYDENTSAGIYGNGLDRPDGEQAATPAAHTPLPWEIFPNYETGTCSIGHYGKSAPLVNHVCELPDIQSPDAAFIVRACNSHARLVDALEEIVRQTNLLPAHLAQKAVADFNAAVVVTVRNVALAAINAEDSP